MDSSRELRTSLLRFLFTSLGAMTLGAIALSGAVGVGYGPWIWLGYGLLACCVLGTSAWIVAQDERGKFSEAMRERLNRHLEDGWPVFVIAIPAFLGGILRSYFPSLTGWLSLPMIVLLLGIMVWAWQRRRDSRLRGRD